MSAQFPFITLVAAAASTITPPAGSPMTAAPMTIVNNLGRPPAKAASRWPLRHCQARVM